jgi:hypothetical protein
MGITEWLAEKFSTVLEGLDPSVTAGVMIFWVGGLFAMYQAPSLTSAWTSTVGVWSFICMIAWGLAWEFRAREIED